MTITLPGKLYELQQRWHTEGWRACPDHHGKGCIECGGSGEFKLPFFDWLEEIEARESIYDDTGKKIARRDMAGNLYDLRGNRIPVTEDVT